MLDIETILAIDSSGATASVAVYREQVIAECVWHSGRRHSSQLLPTIDAMLRLGSLDRGMLTAIAVAVGPGSYSGLRVGISTALGLSEALGLDLVQVPTLEVIVWGSCPPGAAESKAPRSVRAAIEVGRGRYATARYRRAVRHVEAESGIEGAGLGDLLALAIAERALLAVDLDAAARERVERSHGERLELSSPAASARRAGHLAELAALRIRRGDAVTGAVEPIYLH
ncbi:MAG TPA: tRNA (adenosine(37)-N6)-threonylcarbamoyltransferase complex dimerization subunit type 1 TsaB [Chloroflexota bacterium]|nr:tRNA (adenosine(37)-N6)-threonylcarbamoyltransferase complex dimerization subunit type 1 TsaB [Chloroflexota bacterium]